MVSTRRRLIHATVNLSDVFDGDIATADEANDPGDTISPHGRPEWDGSFPFCHLIFPGLVNPVIRSNAPQRPYPSR